MSATLPPVIDAWRAVAARRLYSGALPLGGLARLRDVLADGGGECRYALAFDRDPLGFDVVDLEAEAALPLVCQRTLERFELPVRVKQRLALLRNAEDDAALPEGVEAVQVGEHGEVDPSALIEDELILVVPLVPIDPRAAELPELSAPVEQEPRPNPFAALEALKERKN
jgi:uncharacterized protein